MTRLCLLICLLCSVLILRAPLTCAAPADQYQQQADALWKQAQTLQKAENCRDALPLYEQSLDAEQKSAAPRQADIASTLNQAGYCSSQIGQLPKALEYYQRALQIFKELDKPKSVAVLHNNIGAIQSDTGEKQAALASYQQALKISRALDDESGIASTSSNIGLVYDNLGRYDDAIAQYEEALAINQRLQDEARVAINLNNLGAAYKSQGKYEKALTYYQKALELDRKVGRKQNIAVRLSNIGAVYFEWGQYDKARESFEQALAINKELGRAAGIAINLNNLAEVSDSQGDYEQAISYYTEALTLNRNSGRKEGIATTLNNLGGVYAKQGRVDDALAAYQEALALEREIGRQGGIAITLNNIGLAYRHQGKYDEALTYSEEALAIEEKLGRDDRIATCLNNIGLIYAARDRYAEAKAAYRKALLRSKMLKREGSVATTLNNLAGVLRDSGQYDDAIKTYEEALEIDRRLGRQGETATILGNLGRVYYLKGDIEQARRYYEESLALNRQLGQQDGIAVTLINLGLAHYEQAQYDDAMTAYREALAIHRKSGRASEIANCLNNMGGVEKERGNYPEAVAQYQEALRSYQTLGEQSGIATAHNNIGRVYQEWGRYDDALDEYQTAYILAQNIERADLMASFLTNMGSLFVAWGNYDEAIKNYYTPALGLQQKLGRQHQVALAYNNIGHAYYLQGDRFAALAAFQKAMEMDNDFVGTAASSLYSNNMAAVHEKFGEYDQALAKYEKALELARQAGKMPDVALYLQNIGELYFQQNDLPKALEYTEQALAIARPLNMPKRIAALLNNSGAYHMKQERYQGAIPLLEESIAIKEQLRQTAEGDLRRNYLEQEIHTYRFLIRCYIKLNDYENALRIFELTRAKRLKEQLRPIASDQFEQSALSVRDIQARLADDAALMLYTIFETSIVQILVTRDDVRVAESSIQLADMQTAATAHSAAQQAPIASRGLHLNEEGAPQLLPEETPFQGASDAIALIAYYARLLKGDVAGGRGLALNDDSEAAPTSENGDNFTIIGQRLYDTFFDKTLRELLHTKTHLIIIPDGELNDIPFEALIDEQGKYLVERYAISYAPSIGVLDKIRQRAYRKDRHPLLAFGGAVYESETYKIEMKQNAAEIASMQRQVETALRRGDSARDMYASMELGWINLPGTLAEVRNIGKLVPQSKVITGNDVNEDTVKSWSTSGKLRQYRHLHFATHGIAFPDTPELSALVLSQSEKTTKKEDGYLNMSEVAQLELNADFVNLSACQTGLGKIYAGEGMVGLTQAFLIAGANGVSVSLWQVSDESTSAFMVAFYKLLPEFENDYIRTMAEVKRRFARGDFGEEWTHPYFWAPFIYYGKYGAMRK